MQNSVCEEWSTPFTAVGRKNAGGRAWWEDCLSHGRAEDWPYRDTQEEQERGERKTDLEEESCYKAISSHPTEPCAQALSSQAQIRDEESTAGNSTAHTTRKNISMPENIWATVIIRAIAGGFFF